MVQHADIDHTGLTGVGGSLTVEDEGTPLATSADTLNFVGAGVTATGSGAEKTITIPGGGGSGVAESAYRSDASAAPGSPEAQDDEFEDAAISGSWTRINDGTPDGSYSENYSRLSYHQTATWAADGSDVHVQARTVSIGDYIEIAGQHRGKTNTTMALTCGFATGTTYGTDDAIGVFWHVQNTNVNRWMLNGFTNFQSRAADGTTFDAGLQGQTWYVRVKYEAANTWGLYVSPNGHQWHTVQSNHSLTLSPTHVYFGVYGLNGQTAPAWFLFDYVRINAA